MHGGNQALSLKELCYRMSYLNFFWRTNTEMERICLESTNYARLKGNHMFTMTVEEIKSFLTILLVSRYAGLLKQEMHWERQEGCHNLAVSAMMTKTEFLDCKRCLHLTD